MRAKRYETAAIRYLNAIPERPALTACREPSGTPPGGTPQTHEVAKLTAEVA